jgi:hypothetical protein
MGKSLHPYFGRSAVLTSKHKKLEHFRPIFQSQIGISVSEISLDTDLLGTFSGEIERLDPPRETAIKKATMGMEATGITLGIASEGAIGPDPIIPWVQSNYELALFLDSESGLVISESITSPEIVAATIKVRMGDDLEDFLRRADFPRHHLIVRSEMNPDAQIFKGVADLPSLIMAIKSCAQESPSRIANIESDFRALHSPSRQLNIERVARRLSQRIATLCPGCNLPGWGRVDYLKGVECNQCGDLNDQIISQEILGCSRCDFRELGEVINSQITPDRCSSCNP